MRERERVSERERERKRNILRLKLLKCLHLIIILCVNAGYAAMVTAVPSQLSQ